MADFKCNQCTAICATLPILRTHLKSHNPNSLLHTKCYPNLHKRNPNIKCKIFDNQESYNKHLLEDHKGMSKCNTHGCEFVGTKKNMPGHVEKKHTNEHMKDPRVKHQKCQEWFPQSKLTSHIEECKGLKKLNCEHCDKTFSTQPRLKKHIKSVHETPFNTCVCEFCSEEFKVTHLLRKHIQAVHKEKWDEKFANMSGQVVKKNHCQNCDITFRDTAAFQKHQKSHHCPCCQIKMATPEAVIKHLRKSLTDLEIKMKETQNKYGDYELEKEGQLLWCAICQKKVDNLQKHQIEIHTCKLCSGIFDLPKHEKFCKRTSQNDEKIEETHIENDDHLAEVESETTAKLKCEKCDESFPNGKTLEEHFKKIHKQMPDSYKCKICNKEFVAFPFLQKHEKELHSLPAPTNDALNADTNAKEIDENSGNKNLVNDENRKKSHNKNSLTCKDCKETFTSKPNLFKHINEIHKSKPLELKCQKCTKTFSSKSEFELHMKTVHFKSHTHKCSICDKRFIWKSSIKIHMKRIHEKNTITFTCEYCLSIFRDKVKLKQHIKSMHEDVKPHECSNCSKRFSVKTQLTNHVKNIHEKLKSFKCNLCTKSFNLKIFLTEVVTLSVAECSGHLG